MVDILKLGNSVDDGSAVGLTMEERRQGTYIIGTTGSGKSTLLKNIVYHDMTSDRKHGLCVLDPHGDLIDELLGLVPKDRVNDVILFNPMEIERPFGLNLLECDREDPFQVRWVKSTVISTLERLFHYSWGPRLEDVLRNSLETAMLINDSTFIELLLLLRNKKYRDQAVAKISDPIIRAFWDELPHDHSKQLEIISSTVNKISPFITDRSMRNIIGQTHNTFDLKKDIMDKGKILFVNLSKGDLGEVHSSLLGSVIVNMVLIAALQRRKTRNVNKRLQFHLIVDEFQNFASESFSILQSEARKYAVDVVAAHQYRDQLDLENKGSTLNVGNLIVFRVTGRDSYELASQFNNTPPPAETRVEPVYRDYEYKGQEFLIETKLSTAEGKLYQEVELPRRPYSDVEAERANQLSTLRDYHAWCRLIQRPDSRGKKETPYLVEHFIKTENPTAGLYNEKIAEQIRENSRNLAPDYKDVEEDIRRRTMGEIDADEEIEYAEEIMNKQ